MAKNIRKNFTIRLTDAERDALTRESEMLGMSPTEYIRTLMLHGKSRLYIEYLHGLVEQINTKMGELAEQKAAPQIATTSQDGAVASPDVLQRILTGLQVLRLKVEHIEAFADGRGVTAFGTTALHAQGVDTQIMERDAVEVFCRKFKK
ncbi:plasmid mobilization protein [Acidithiobacillus sp.]|nr:hypothetical protein [Planctomycetia bacterium]